MWIGRGASLYSMYDIFEPGRTGTAMLSKNNAFRCSLPESRLLDARYFGIVCSHKGISEEPRYRTSILPKKFAAKMSFHMPAFAKRIGRRGIPPGASSLSGADTRRYKSYVPYDSPFGTVK